MPQGTGKCRRKWKHQHTQQGEIRVFAGSKEKGRYVVIDDDGSICSKLVAKPKVFVPESWIRKIEGFNAQVQR